MSDVSFYGEFAYEAYAKTAKTYGKVLPDWEALNEFEQYAWISAGEACADRAVGQYEYQGQAT